MSLVSPFPNTPLRYSSHHSAQTSYTPAVDFFPHRFLYPSTSVVAQTSYTPDVYFFLLAFRTASCNPSPFVVMTAEYPSLSSSSRPLLISTVPSTSALSPTRFPLPSKASSHSSSLSKIKTQQIKSSTRYATRFLRHCVRAIVVALFEHLDARGRS